MTEQYKPTVEQRYGQKLDGYAVSMTVNFITNNGRLSVEQKNIATKIARDTILDTTNSPHPNHLRQSLENYIDKERQFALQQMINCLNPSFSQNLSETMNELDSLDGASVDLMPIGIDELEKQIRENDSEDLFEPLIQLVPANNRIVYKAFRRQYLDLDVVEKLIPQIMEICFPHL